MGYGSFRYRLVLALVVVLVLWQSTRNWSPFADETSPVKESAGRTTATGPPVGTNVQKVLVSVYYEALCPDSRSFVMKQLMPTYKRIHENMQVELIPYGKAKTIVTPNGYEFTCQHGPIECQANMIHACSIDVIKNESVLLEYISCMIQNNMEPENAMKNCGRQLEVDYQTIQKCFEGDRGKDLLAMYGKSTDALRPQVSFIPTITLDKQADNLPAILKNLLKQVCLKLKSPPKGCI